MDPAALDFSALNWTGFALAAVFNVVLGFVWYAAWSPTGKIWIRETKMDVTRKVPGGEMAVAMGLMLVGVLLMMFVFTHTNAVYEDAFRNVATGGKAAYELTLADGLTGGLFTWLGFIVPVGLNTVAFERRSWSLFFVNAGYYLVALLAAGALIALTG